MKKVFFIIIAIALLMIGYIANEFGAYYWCQEEAITENSNEEIKPFTQELWKGTMVIYNPIEGDESYGLRISIRDERADKTAPWRDWSITAKHYAEVRIEIDDQVKELTLNEFRELIFGGER